MSKANAKIIKAAPIFSALGEPNRLRIVTRLAQEGPQSIVNLTDSTEVSRQAVTKHLTALEEAGLVKSLKEGRERIWSLNTDKLSEAQQYLSTISKQWDDILENLRSYVEDDG